MIDFFKFLRKRFGVADSFSWFQNVREGLLQIHQKWVRYFDCATFFCHLMMPNIIFFVKESGTILVSEIAEAEEYNFPGPFSFLCHSLFVQAFQVKQFTKSKWPPWYSRSFSYRHIKGSNSKSCGLVMLSLNVLTSNHAPMPYTLPRLRSRSPNTCSCFDLVGSDSDCTLLFANFSNVVLWSKWWFVREFNICS